MATWYFKVHGGDFKKGKGSYSEGWFSKTFLLLGFFFPCIVKTDVEAVELVTDEMVKAGPSKAGAGAAGLLLFGPIGAALGVLIGGKEKRETMFVVRFTDGKSFLGSSDLATFQKLKVLSLISKKKYTQHE